MSEGTVTGRHRPELDFETYSRWGVPGTPSDDLKRGAVILSVGAGTDFATIEARMLALMTDPAVTGVVLDLETDAEGGVELPGRSFLQITGKTTFSEAERRWFPLPHKKTRPLRPAPPYLKHDPTKRGYGRGRRN